jgi:hypothetical protein
VTDSGAQGDLAVLLQGLRAACPAVTPDGRAGWGVAEDAYNALSSSGGMPNASCYERNGYVLLSELVRLHRANPTANLYVGSGTGGGYAGC